MGKDIKEMIFAEDKIKSKIKKIEVPYINFEGEHKVGEIEVSERISVRALLLFRNLYKINFPINKIEITKGRPDSEMIKNNITSGFNFRTVAGTKRLSKHAFGLAIDINPKNNPAKPSSMADLYDESIKKGKLNKDIIKLIKSYGFEWGGEIFGDFWDSHHFEIKLTQSEIKLKKIYECHDNKA